MQTRLTSFVEASLNTMSGFIISYGLGVLIYPWFGLSVTLEQNFWIVVIFTVVSVIRSYVWRRLFNASIDTVSRNMHNASTSLENSV